MLPLAFHMQTVNNDRDLLLGQNGQNAEAIRQISFGCSRIVAQNQFAVDWRLLKICNEDPKQFAHVQWKALVTKRCNRSIY